MTRPLATTARVALATFVTVVVVLVAAPVARAGSDDDPGVLGAVSGSADSGTDDIATRQVELDGADREPRGRPLVIDRLATATVLMIRASGFAAGTTGVAAQCEESARCRNKLPVRFDDEGNAVFQYLITDEVSAEGRCRLGASRCTIEIDDGAETVLVVDTVFVDEAPVPGELTLEPEAGLRRGDTVIVTATGFPVGADLVVSVCAGPDGSGERCGDPGPVVDVTAGPDGSAEATLRVPSEVGTDRVACGRRSACRLVVTSPDLGVWARPVPLSFAGVPGADYEAGRLVAGLVAAFALVSAGVWLWRSTDWSPPPEADASAIDDAEYADLDAEAAAFEPPALSVDGTFDTSR